MKEHLLLIFSVMSDLFLLCVPPIVFVVVQREVNKIDGRFWRQVARAGLVYITILIYVLLVLAVMTQWDSGTLNLLKELYEQAL